MKFSIIGQDKPNSVSLRLSKREEHRAFLHGDRSAFEAKLVFGRPLLAEDGETPIGTPVVIEGPSRAFAQQLVADDLYTSAGRFARLDIMALCNRSTDGGMI